MNKTKFDKLFKKQKSKKSLSNKSSDKPPKKRAPKKEGSKQEDKALIESLKTSISRELNDKDTAKKAALIIEEMLKSKEKK
ncbi:MAG: hypothetical protein VXY34_04610 [Bdellovibrionota bacterium]|nr:hypothetical protein [Bdellovibrionota bacterium]